MGDSKFVFEANDTTFDNDVLKHDGPVIVDFWAEWCGPCKALAPVLDELAQEYDGRVKVVKVNVDESPGTPQQYNVRGIPTLIAFKGGEVVNQLVGNQPRETIKGTFDAICS